MEDTYKLIDELRIKMEKVGFQFEKSQRPHFQNKRDFELKFVHPILQMKFEHDGLNSGATKYYIKPLADTPGSEIGFVTGRTSPLLSDPRFGMPNAMDTFDNSLAWANRINDSSLDYLLNAIDNYLNASSIVSAQYSKSYLFAWNPKQWRWNDLQDCIDSLNKVGQIERKWSCGNSKKIKKGDRVFLIRLGKEPRGIFGSGYAKSSYYVSSHWDGTPGKLTHYIDIEFDILINPEKSRIFDFEMLKKVDLQRVQQWSPQQSGISINPSVIEALESSWFKFITDNKVIGKSFIANDILLDTTETFWEGKSKDITQTRYERNPQARRMCIMHHGCSCKICGFNFESNFGDYGKGFIHVHHIEPISERGDEYEIDPKRDLIPVCPNCHAMIHLRRPAYTIDEIKTMKTNSP